MIFYKNIPKIQAISFDLDDTLYDNYPIMRRAEKKLLAFMQEQFPLTAGKSLHFWQHIKHQLLTDTPDLAFDMGELRRRTLRSGLEMCGYKGHEVESYVTRCFDYFYHERSNFVVDKSVTELLEQLSQRVPLVGITNGNVNLEQIGISRYFKTCFHARLHQPMKPHPKMFLMTISLLDLPASSILHVGDNLEKDVMGASNVGFNTAWFACDRRMDLEKERTRVLPHVQLDNLQELLNFV